MYQVRPQEEITTYTWKINKITQHILYLEEKRKNNPPVIDDLVKYWIDKLNHYQEKEEEEIRLKKLRKAVAEIKAREELEAKG